MRILRHVVDPMEIPDNDIEKVFHSITQPFLGQAKIVNNKIVLMEMYRHATRADSAELTTEKTCRPALTQKNIWRRLRGRK